MLMTCRWPHTRLARVHVHTYALVQPHAQYMCRNLSQVRAEEGRRTDSAHFRPSRRTFFCSPNACERTTGPKTTPPPRICAPREESGCLIGTPHVLCRRKPSATSRKPQHELPLALHEIRCFILEATYWHKLTFQWCLLLVPQDEPNTHRQVGFGNDLSDTTALKGKLCLSEMPLG